MMIDPSMKRTLRRATRSWARVREANALVDEMKKREQELADHRVTDVEDWIRIVTTRSQAITFLRRIVKAGQDEAIGEASQWLDELDQQEKK